MLGEDDMGAFSLQGSSNGHSATIQMSGDGGFSTLSVQRSLSGDRRSTATEGMS